MLKSIVADQILFSKKEQSKNNSKLFQNNFQLKNRQKTNQLVSDAISASGKGVAVACVPM